MTAPPASVRAGVGIGGSSWPAPSPESFLSWEMSDFSFGARIRRIALWSVLHHICRPIYVDVDPRGLSCAVEFI